MVTLFSNPVPVLILLGISLVLYIAWALLPGFLAKSKGRSFWGFFALGILSPLVLTIVVLCLKDRKSADEEAEQIVFDTEAPAVLEVTESVADEDASAAMEEADAQAAENCDAAVADEKVVSDEEAAAAEEAAMDEEAAIDEEAAMDEESAVDEEAEAEKKPVNQNKKRVIIAVVVSVLAIAAIFVCTFFAVKLALQDIAGEMIFDPDGAYAQNDVTALSDYSVPEATPADENMMTVIAVDRDGNPAMTNADMQIWYWNEFTSFMQQYGSYASMFGLDYNSPLSSQPSLEENLSWEQMFLKSAATNKSVNYALAQAAYANGYTISEEDQQTINDFSAADGSLAQAAAEAGYTDVNEYIQLYYGTGVTLDTYVDYVKECLAHNYAYQLLQTEIEASITDDAISAYYDEHAEEMEANRVLKLNNVSVRHILITPEGEQDETTGDYSEEAWEAAKEKADEIYALWQEDPTEDNFSTLANENSDDGGSNTTGGLYENFDTDDMVEEFSDWAFDPSREYGDTDIVKTSYGYHIMFFVEQTDTKGWVETTREQLLSSLFNERIDALCEEYPLNFDYTKVRLFDWITFTMNLNLETADTEATAAPEG